VSGNMGPFRPDELAGDGLDIPDAERAASYATARELEQALTPDTVRPSAGFADRVMATVAAEPIHRPTGFIAPLRARRDLAGLVASVRAAWAMAVGAGARPAGSRGLAMAYVLAVLLVGASLTGVAAFGAAGAIGLLTPDASPTPSIITPSPTPTPDSSSESDEPSASSEPGETLEPSESPDASGSTEPSDSHQPEDSSGPGATATPRQSDDNGGATASPSSDDHGGATASPGSGEETSGGDGSTSTQSPKPSDTPQPSDTPEASQSN